MNVKFNSGSVGASRFSDSLQRVGSLGPNWMVGYSDPTQASFAVPTVTVNASGLLLENATGGGSSISMLLQPTTIFSVLGKTQFAELTIVAKVGTISFEGGPAVATTGDPLSGGANGYYIPPSFVPTIGVHAANFGDATIIANTSNWIVGDILRISVTFNIGSNHVVLTKNGITVATVDDASVNRPITGLPGIYFRSASAGSGMRFSNFRGGLGLG